MPFLDLAAYFRRIGYAGSPAPTLETLHALHWAHVTSIPFENLNPWTQRPVPLDLASIEAKLVHARRGGYCFETNELFRAALVQLGFTVTPLLGRVHWMLPPDFQPARSHQMLRVDLDGQAWTVDVGFGGLCQTAPLRLEHGTVQNTPHEPRRFDIENNVATLWARLSAKRWEKLYSFELTPAVPLDYEVANWYTSTHPDSKFRKNLFICLPQEGRRLTFLNGDFTRRFLDGRVEKQHITTDAELRRLLVDVFGLPAEDPAVREIRLTAVAG
jgi:N-hydroxyarylamine O-acetyltransferase